jgi:hypothetical protein
MKDFFKALLAVAAVVSAFWIGFHLGKREQKNKIPEFQED